MTYCGLCLVQGAIVLFPKAPRSRFLSALRAHWLLVAGPAAVVTAATFLPPVAAALAISLSSLALVVVPSLAILGIGWAARRADWRLTPVVVPAVVVAWLTPGSTLGEAAALFLVVLSCVGLAVAIVAILPPVVGKAGIVVWAAADVALALAHGLERASRAITEASPAIGPPQLQLQRVLIGHSSMEYADLFLAAGLGAILALESRRQGRAALLVAILGIALGAFLFITNVVPATLPVAVALGAEELSMRPARRPTPVEEHSPSSSA
jgi:hypothetical protein